ncbi:MAG: glycine cleavage system protein H [Candidatus Muproteobacteria bacterium RBG_16_64_10]|uniref:Glycine cleavage system H protein n=1 Tax=Candidatus Muproteobacteria bacterium RBG_16_64_10 TaxID=1817757 RepID=A0A1F6T7C1_9PROT|nr:MAG: glycine cleavage system protein H [Candidatus Muproteobacteria bacterium RBG_16_64_10]
MSNAPKELKYTKSHEWVKVEADGTLTVGITDHAQGLMGDMVYVELPEAGRKVEANKECAVVESVKAASDVYAPVAGEIAAANGALSDAPETLNKDPYGAGWMFKLKPASKAEVDALMDAKAYEALVASEKH